MKDNTKDSRKNNITLIGMPAAGKSTVGVLLAKRLGYSFIDVDIVIQEEEGKLLKEIIKEQGLDGFMEGQCRTQGKPGRNRSRRQRDIWKRSHGKPEISWSGGLP